ncbi:MAG: winged helix DNA-binding domain-containing protein [Jatrophihabitans sp.]
MTVKVLDRRARNRALLARQFLLERGTVSPLTVIARLVGMQAQTPRSPYTALWSRLSGFDPMTLSRAIERRSCVRIALMRSTIHLVTAADALLLRPLIVPIIMRELTNPTWARPLAGLDLEPVAAEARRLLELQPRTPAQLGAALADTWPDREARALAHAARSLLPLVQIPPRGLWDGAGSTRLTTAEHWLGRPVRTDSSWDDVAWRYLAAFGPATAADLVAWCRVTGLAEVIARLRPRLTVLHDENGKELFDVPRSPRPPANTEAPPRFLPDYDNVLLGHADRRHVIQDAHRKALQSVNGVLPGTVLVDGFVAAQWAIERDKSLARLVVTCLEPLKGRHREAVTDEGAALLGLLAPDATKQEIVLR